MGPWIYPDMRLGNCRAGTWELQGVDGLPCLEQTTTTGGLRTIMLSIRVPHMHNAQ